MSSRPGLPPARVLAIWAVAGGLALAAFSGPLAPLRSLFILLVVAGGVLAAAAYMLWSVHPAWTLSAGLVLSVFAGNWGHLGVPGMFAPDRLLFVAGIGAVVLRAPGVRDREPLRFGAVHWAMVVTLLWFTGSALAAGSLEERAAVFALLERVGLIPFMLFLVAPAAFATPQHRRILLGGLVTIGAYLGFTALMETLDFRGLVFPSFINDSGIGTHSDRARGPFLEAVTNGAGLYVGVIGAAIAIVLWRAERWRLAAAAVLVFCFAGLLFTETRSVWLAGALGTVLALLSTRELRRFSVPAIAGGAVVVAISIAIVPGVSSAIEERTGDSATVWDRKNLAVAAVNMVEAYPLTGVGWQRFTAESADHFRVARDYPLTAVDEIIHNVFLTYAAETGLVGLALWITTLALGMIAALWPPGRGEARLWQLGVWAYLLFFLVISNFVFPQVFPNAALWLLAGVAVGAGASADRPRRPAS